MRFGLLARLWMLGLLLATAPAWATSYYVRKDGVDTNTGLADDAATAWLTVSKALATVPLTGDHTINIGDGTYQENTSGGGYLRPDRACAGTITIQPTTGVYGGVIVQGSSSATYNVRLDGPTSGFQFFKIAFTARAGSLSALTCDSAVALSGIGFTDCAFTADNAASTYAVKIDSTASGGVYTLTFTRCTFTTAHASATYTVYCNGTGATGARTITLTDCTISASTVGLYTRGTHTIVAVRGGTYTATSNKAISIGDDGASGEATYASIIGAKVVSTASHSLLLGAQCDGVLVADCEIRGGDHALVLKKCTNAVIVRNTIYAGTQNAILLKGATGCRVERNTAINGTAGKAVIANYDGAALYTNSGHIIRRNVFQATGTAEIFYWHASGEADATTRIDENDYRISGGGNFGLVRGTDNCSTLRAVRDAWAAAGYPRNDAHSTTWGRGARGSRILRKAR
jgi:hypothetical protein